MSDRSSAPAILTLTAAPSNLIAGEKATISGSVRTAFGEPVEDGTDVRLITNFGGRLVHEEVETFRGSFTTFLLTSSVHHGPYEVVAEVVGAKLFAQVTVNALLMPRAEPAMRVTQAGQAARIQPRSRTNPPLFATSLRLGGLSLIIVIIAGLGYIIWNSPQRETPALQVLDILVSWPASVFALGCLFVLAFRNEIGGYINRMKAFGVGPGGISSTAEQAEPPESKPPEPPEAHEVEQNLKELEETLTGSDAQRALLEARVRELAQEYQNAVQEGRLWWGQFLNLFLAPVTKDVLQWFARTSEQTQISTDTFHQTWRPFIPDDQQRQTVLDVLLAYGLVAYTGAFLTLTDGGRLSLRYLSPPAPAVSPQPPVAESPSTSGAPSVQV